MSGNATTIFARLSDGNGCRSFVIHVNGFIKNATVDGAIPITVMLPPIKAPAKKPNNAQVFTVIE